jgi:hypothetical protein
MKATGRSVAFSLWCWGADGRSGGSTGWSPGRRRRSSRCARPGGQRPCGRNRRSRRGEGRQALLGFGAHVRGHGLFGQVQ